MLGVDEDNIHCKFTTKYPIKKIAKYKIKSIDSADVEQRMIIRDGNCNDTDLDIKSGTSYVLGVFLDGKLVSNTVNVMTSKRNFNPTNSNYLPQPPSISSIKQYYDESKENVLIIWDYPPQTVGDKILYKVKLSNKQNTEKVYEMPYRLSVSSLSKTKIEIRIATISIIDGRSYESAMSTNICIDL